MTMKKVFYILLAAFMMLPSLASAQQNLRSGYFLDGYVYKYKMNPAMAPERGFVAMPVLSNLSVGAETDFGLGTFLYPTETGITTFLSPRVDNETFLNNIDENNKANVNLDMTLLAVGFSKGKSYHTVDISMRTDLGVNVPGELFKFMKLGNSLSNSWNIANVGARSATRLEASYGYSRSFLDDALRVGARAKLLWGVYRVDAAIDRLSLEMGEDKWIVGAHGNMMMSAPVSFTVAEDNTIDFTALDTENLLPNLMKPNLGFAFDLGATYDFLDYFTASFSVLDLGMMSWKNTMLAETPDTQWEFSGFETIDVETIEDEIAGLVEDITDVFSFEQKENGIKKSSMLAATIHAGIEARMPFYERLSFGMLYTQRLEKAYSWSEGRFAASVAPLDWLSATTNYAISNFGHSWGGAINIHAPGFGLFVGLDSFVPLFNVSPQFIPIASINTNLSLGINFTFGEYKGRYPMKASKKSSATTPKKTITTVKTVTVETTETVH